MSVLIGERRSVRQAREQDNARNNLCHAHRRSSDVGREQLMFHHMR
jgi:hypothetical protein